MTSLERVLATFEGKSTDKIPIHHIGFSGYAASVILGREAYVGGQIQQWREMNALWEGPDARKEFLERSEKDAVDVALAADHDILRLQYWRWSTKPTKKIDEYTFLFGDPEKSWYIIHFDPEIELFHRTEGYGKKTQKMTAQRQPMNLERLEASLEKQEKELAKLPEPSYEPDPEIQKTLQKYNDYAVRIGGSTVSIPYQQVWLEATALRPDLVARHIDIQAERACRQMVRLAASGVKLVFAGSDFASNEGPMYSPKVFRELVLPGLKKITEKCHKYGMYYLFASDGNLWPVADALFGESGVDGYFEIDRRAGMCLDKLRKRFTDLTLIGNISSHTLHLGTKEQVIQEVLSCIDTAEKYGGIIIGTSNYIMPSTPKENIIAMLDTLRNRC